MLEASCHILGFCSNHPDIETGESARGEGRWREARSRRVRTDQLKNAAVRNERGTSFGLERTCCSGFGPSQRALSRGERVQIHHYQQRRLQGTLPVKTTTFIFFPVPTYNSGNKEYGRRDWMCGLHEKNGAQSCWGHCPLSWLSPLKDSPRKAQGSTTTNSTSGSECLLNARSGRPRGRGGTADRPCPMPCWPWTTALSGASRGPSCPSSSEPARSKVCSPGA